MTVDKNYPYTWIKFQTDRDMCSNCIATCCMMPVEVTKEELLALDLTFEAELEDERKLAKRLMKEGLIERYRQGTGLFTLASNEDGECMFLDTETRECTVYENRPSVCLDFPLKRGSRIGYCPKIRRPK